MKRGVTGAKMNNLLIAVPTLLVCIVIVQNIGAIVYPPAFKCDVLWCNSGEDYQYCTQEVHRRCLLCKDMEDRHCYTIRMPLNCSFYCHERLLKIEREKACPLLKPLSHGSHNGSTNPSYEDIVTFQCNDGYKLEGPNLITCLFGMWSFHPPTCEERLLKIEREKACPLLKPLSHGSHNGSTNPSSGDIVTFQCNDGYKLEGPNLITCLFGMWSFHPPTCEAILCSVPTLSYGTIGYFNVTNAVDTRIDYKCEEGYVTADPDGEARCTPDGKWVNLQCIYIPETHTGGAWKKLAITACVTCAGLVGVLCFVLYMYKKKNPSSENKQEWAIEHVMTDYGAPDDKKKEGKIESKPLPPRSEPTDESESDVTDSASERLLPPVRRTSDADDTSTTGVTIDMEPNSDSEPEELSQPDDKTEKKGSTKRQANSSSSSDDTSCSSKEEIQTSSPLSAKTVTIINISGDNTNVQGFGNSNKGDVVTNIATNKDNMSVHTEDTMLGEKNTVKTIADDASYPVQVSSVDDNTPVNDDDITLKTTSGACDRQNKTINSNTENVRGDATPGSPHMHAQTCDRTSGMIALPQNNVHPSDLKHKSTKP